MTKLDRRRSRPAPRFLFALLMAGGLVLGGFAAPALADPAQNAADAAANVQSETDQQSGAAMRISSMDVSLLDEDPGPVDPPVDDDCPGLPNIDAEPTVPGCQSTTCLLDPQQENCPPPADDCDGVDFNGDESGCGEPPPVLECPGGDFNGAEEGCGTPPGDDGNNGGGNDTPPPHSGGGGGHGGHGNGPGGHGNGPGGTTGGNPTTIGSSTGAPEGVVPGAKAAQASSPVSCDPVICARTGVIAQQPAPATTTTPTQAATSGAAQTLPDTGAPVHSTLLALLGLGLVGGGLVLVRRPRGRHRLARG